jgi:uncharacterized glyoxalase superfamily protein PhnB
MANTIYASMRYRDSKAMIEWLERAFGFERKAVHEQDGTVLHAELRYGEGIVMLGDWRGEDDFRRPGQGWAYVVVEDIDDHHRRAVQAGAEIAMPVTHQDYGSFYEARDPEGNLWDFGTYQPAPHPR